MVFKKIRPITPSTRHLIKLKSTVFNKFPKIKKFIKGTFKKSGRNNQGKITVYHKGGGHKKKYRTLKFFNEKKKFIVTNIEYDPYRNSNLISLYDLNKKAYFYQIATKNVKIGDIIEQGDSNINLKNGNRLPLSKIPNGVLINNVSVKSYKKSQLSKSAGTFCKIIKNHKTYVELKLKSGKKKTIPNKNYATLGVVSNEHYNQMTIGKAGRSRWLNIRPTVRGVAMNPIDHPHGGGEGKTSGGRSSVSPWGKPTK